MRLLIVPFILAAMLIQAPAQGNINQEAAEKIANVIGERFPNADIDVSYQSGTVWLKGNAGSQDERKKIVEQVSKIPGVQVAEIKNEIKAPAPQAVPQAVSTPAPAARPAVTAMANPPVPMPNTRIQNTTENTAQKAPQKTWTTDRQIPPYVPTNVKQAPKEQPQQAVQQLPLQQPFVQAATQPYPYQYYPAAYGVNPGQPSGVPEPYAPAPYQVPPQMMYEQPSPQYAAQYAQQPQYYPPQQYQPAYGPPAQAAYHPEAYGPQGPLPGRYNQPNLPDYAWPAYANYPNYAQVSYPRAYSPKAWPYIGPFYPYPQVPTGWRKVTLEHHNGSWWLDFDDGTPSGPFNGLFRQSQQYTY